MNTAAAIPSPAELVPDDFEPLCEHCGYSLTGLTTQTRCPECGQPIPIDSLPLARVPWLYRKRLGNRDAYRKTVWMILRHPRAFADELCRPVRISAQDATRFRRRTTQRAAAAAIVMLISLALRPLFFAFANPDLFRLVPLIAGAGLLYIVFYGFFTFATDLPVFIWSGLWTNPNELAPLHHYASAPLALFPWYVLLLMPVTLSIVVLNPMSTIWGPLFLDALMIYIGLCTLPLLFLLWRWPQILMKQATNCSKLRVVALAIYLPIHWILIGFVSLAAAAVAMGIIMSSLR